MAMVNPMLNLANVKDSRWLTLEVCREFQRNKCTRTDTECKFAHPPPHVEVQNGRVTACFDSIKGKCQRKDPPCKYLHPPQHLREQLLQNGRNNLIIKNLQIQAAQAAALSPPAMVPSLLPVSTNLVYGSTIPQYTARSRTETQMPGKTAVAYSTVLPASGTYPMLDGMMYSNWPNTFEGHPYLNTPTSAVQFNPYLNTGMPTIAVQSNGESHPLMSHPGVIPNAIPNATAGKVQRPDRLEVCREFQRGTCTRQPSECRYAHPPENVTVESTDNHVTVCMDFVKGKCTRDSCRYFHPPLHLQAQIKATQQRANAAAAAQAQALTTIPGMMGQYKRVAIADAKSGLPMYQPSNNMQYQQAIQAMQLQHQPYIPMTLPMVIPQVADPMATVVAATAPSPAGLTPSNAYSVNYFDENKQLLDTLQVCRDFKLGLCQRPQCKYIHVVEDYVEVTDGRVTVCRDAVRRKCTRPTCKYYHIPVPLPPSE